MEEGVALVGDEVQRLGGIQKCEDAIVYIVIYRFISKLRIF